MGRESCFQIENGVLVKYIPTSPASSVTVPSGVTEIGANAFASSSVTEVILPDGLFHIDVMAFANCSSLNSISFPNSLLSIREGSFRSCTGLTEITFPAKLTYIANGSFSGCRNISSVYFDADTSLTARIFNDFIPSRIHAADLSRVSNQLKPYAVLGYFSENYDISSDRGIQHLSYLRKNMGILINIILDNLFLLEVVIANDLPFDLETYLETASNRQNLEAIVMLLEYKEKKGL